MKIPITGSILLLFVLLETGYPGGEFQPSLPQCIDLALKNSYEVQSKVQQIDAAKSLYQQSRSNYYPTIFAEGSQQQFFYTLYDYRNLSGFVVLDWSIGDWLANSAAADQNEIQSRQAEQERARLAVIQRVAALYLGIVQQQFNRQQLQYHLDLLERHINTARALWQAGARPRLDVLQSEAQRYRLQEEALSIDTRTENLRRELADLLSLPDANALQLPDFSEEKIETKAGAALAQFQISAIPQNPEVTLLALQEQSRRLRLREVKASLLPHLQFSGGFVADADPTAEGNYWLAEARLQFPLFQWGRSKYQRQEILADARALELQKSDLLRELQIQVMQISGKIKELQKTLTLQREQLKLNQQAFDLASAHYQAGLITNIEYLTAQQELGDNQFQIHDSSLNILMNLIHLYALTNQTDKISQLQEAAK